MCEVGRRINVPTHALDGDDLVGMMERNDADVAWMRFGGEKGWTLGL